MSVVTKDTIQPSSGQALTIKDEGGTASITVATNGEATFAENIKITNGKGINFSAVSGSSGGSSSALLDDYEEGVVDLTNLNVSSSSDTHALNTSYSSYSYVKVGNICTVQGSFIFNSDFSGTDGDLEIPIPFTTASPGELSGRSVGTFVHEAVSIYAIRVNDGGTNAFIQASGAGINVYKNASEFTGSQRIIYTLTYRTV